MRALVVGGTGFVGLSIVDALLAAGVNVRVTRRKQSVTVLVRRRPVELVDASLSEPHKLASAMEGCDVVFLAGAHYPRYSLDLAASMEEGVAGVRNACAAALSAGVPRFVYTSTIATLAKAPDGRAATEDDVHEELPTGSVYRAIKWAMEREVDAAAARGLDAVTLLPGGCLGPNDLRVGTSSILVGVCRGLMPWWVDGTVNLVDVGSVGVAHVAAATRGRRSRYTLAGNTVRVRELLRGIARRYGGTMPPRELDALEARQAADDEERAAAPTKQRVAVPRELVDMATTGQPVSDARAVAELDFAPLALDETLDAAHAWLARCGFVPKVPAERTLNATP